MMGVDLTAIPTVGPGTALVIASEIGPDFSAFPSAQHFCSWLALAPGTRISWRQEPPRQVPEGGQPRDGQALRMAGHGRAPQPDLHRQPSTAQGSPEWTPPSATQGDRPRTRLPRLPDGDRMASQYVEQGIGAYREAAPQQEVSLISTAKPENSGSNSSRKCKERKNRTQWLLQSLRHLLLKSIKRAYEQRYPTGVLCYKAGGDGTCG